MHDPTFEVRVSGDLLEFGIDQAQVQRHITEWLVLSLFTEGRVSSGKAAQLLKLTRIDFLRLLRKRGIAYIDYTAEELREEFDAVGALQLDLTQ